MLQQQKSKMREWLRNWAVGTKESINESLTCLKVAINRCLIVFDKAMSEGLQEREANVTGTKNQEELGMLVAESSATVLHVVIWEVKNVPNELGDAEISSEGVKSASWFVFVAYNRIQEERHKLKEELLNQKEPGMILKILRFLRQQTMLKLRNGFQAKNKSRVLPERKTAQI